MVLHDCRTAIGQGRPGRAPIDATGGADSASPWTSASGVPPLQARSSIQPASLRQSGCSGHAGQDHLHEMLELSRPRTVHPIHTTTPARLHPRVIPAYGHHYPLAAPR